ncbi:MAG: SDR family oxidoreductase, partial [Betaproteobacteria bacterium]
MEDKLFSVKDQIVLIPGGSRGIGRAIANEFAVRDARVILAGREEETLKKTASEISEGAKPVEYFVCDISKESEIDALVTHVVGRHGRIDTLINVAGVNKRMKVENYTAEEYDWITDINARGAFMVAQKVGQQLIKQKAGNIINVDS